MAAKKGPKKHSLVKEAKKNPHAASADNAGEAKSRQLHLPAGKLLRFKRVKHPEKLPSARRLSKKTILLLASRWRLFLGIALLYAFLNLILVRGFNIGIDVDSLKQQFSLGLHGDIGQLTAGVQVFMQMVQSLGNTSDPAAGAYQLFLWLIASLAAIWAIRQTAAGKRVGVRDAFYKGMYPLVPFIIVIIITLIQLIPLLFGGLLYALVTSTGIALLAAEKIIWGIPCLIMAWLSLYMLSSSIFALYIVTLPDMTPRKALKSARDLVRYRRGQVLRKVLFMPVALGIIMLLLVLPAIFFLPAAAPWLLFMLVTVALVIAYAYLYVLYKELLA